MQSAFLCTGGENLDAIAGRMRELVPAPAHPVAVDLRAHCDVTIPQCVADEAAEAASALTQLSPCPQGMSGWRDYRSRFTDRYGLGAVIPVADLLDPVTGLGLPSHYSAPSVAAWGARDERLAVLAQQAALDGAIEIDLGGTLLRELAEPDSRGIQPVPHMDITVDLRAASLRALKEGAFTVSVCAVGRTAMATSGRFLHLLSGPERERLGRLYRDLPTATRGALAVQLSFPPRHPRTENVTSVPPVLPCLLSLGEYHGQHGPARISLDDLAVTASTDRLHLISLSRGMPVEPVLACAPAWHVVPPVARLLFELPRSHCPPAAMFSWGAAASLPFVPRLRLGRAILSPARWRIRTSDLPGPQASQQEWTAALEGLRDKLGLPEWISAGQRDRQLRLSLDQPMDLAVLRAHLDASASTTVLTESWAPDDHAWCGGRAHELVIPLTATGTPARPPGVLARRGPFPASAVTTGTCPGQAAFCPPGSTATRPCSTSS